MQQFFEEHKKHIIIAVIVILVLAAVLTSWKKLNASLLENAVGMAVSPFQSITTGAGNKIKDGLASPRDEEDLEDENEALRREVASLEADNKRLALYEEENKKLSALLKISQKYPKHNGVGANIIAKNPGVWYDIFTIDKGTKDKLSANMVLITPEGLVGKVLESGTTFSKAQSILDSRSSVPAMSLRTGDLGVVKGDYSLMNKGLCKMEYIDGEAEIMVGDEIVTSQLSDIYPAGISIGRVSEVETAPNGLTKYAIVEPYVDLKHLDTLLVIDKTSPANKAPAKKEKKKEQPAETAKKKPEASAAEGTEAEGEE